MTGAADTHLSPATGTGSLEQARRTSHLTDGTVELRGEQDIFGVAFDSGSWAAKSVAGTSWTGGTFNGRGWTGTSWSGTIWSGRMRSGRMWSVDIWCGWMWSGRKWSTGLYQSRRHGYENAIVGQDVEMHDAFGPPVPILGAV